MIKQLSYCLCGVNLAWAWLRRWPQRCNLFPPLLGSHILSPILDDGTICGVVVARSQTGAKLVWFVNEPTSLALAWVNHRLWKCNFLAWQVFAGTVCSAAVEHVHLCLHSRDCTVRRSVTPSFFSVLENLCEPTTYEQVSVNASHARILGTSWGVSRVLSSSSSWRPWGRLVKTFVVPSFFQGFSITSIFLGTST